MKIRFLKDCTAPQMRYTWCCEICGHVPTGMEPNYFMAGEEVDPVGEEIDLSPLTYRIDYDIIEYP